MSFNFSQSSNWNFDSTTIYIESTLTSLLMIYKRPYNLRLGLVVVVQSFLFMCLCHAKYADTNVHHE